MPGIQLLKKEFEQKLQEQKEAFQAKLESVSKAIAEIDMLKYELALLQGQDKEMVTEEVAMPVHPQAVSLRRFVVPDFKNKNRKETLAEWATVLKPQIKRYEDKEEFFSSPDLVKLDLDSMITGDFKGLLIHRSINRHDRWIARRAIILRAVKDTKRSLLVEVFILDSEGLDTPEFRDNIIKSVLSGETMGEKSG